MAEKMIKIMEERLKEKAAVTDKLHSKNHALKVLCCILLVACCICAALVSPFPTHSNFSPFPTHNNDYPTSALATILWVSVYGLVQDQYLCLHANLPSNNWNIDVDDMMTLSPDLQQCEDDVNEMMTCLLICSCSLRRCKSGRWSSSCIRRRTWARCCMLLTLIS